MLRILCLLLLLVASTSCGAEAPAVEEKAAQSPPPPPPTFTFTGFDSDHAAVMQEVLAGLGANPQLTGATLGDSVDDGDVEPLHNGDSYVLLHADWTDESDCFRVDWQSNVALAAYWYRMHERGEWVRGGHTVWNENGTDERFPGENGECQAGYVFNADASKYLFSGSSGVPARFEIDRTDFEKLIRTRTKELGLTIDRLDLAGIIGTTVELEATSADPISIADDRRLWNLLEPEGDAELEGRYFVLRDADGELAVHTAWSAGLQSGSCGSSEKYFEYYDCGH